MIRPAEKTLSDPRARPSPELLLRLYREMVRLRKLDERMMTLQRQGRVGFYGACTGPEAAALAASIALEPSDCLFPALRARMNQALAERGEPKLSYLPFIAKALVAAFRKYPHLNAVMDEARQELVVKSDVNLGFGAATDQGLTVFVVKNVESLGLRDIGAEIDRLATAAREQKLAIHELQGGTFTVTSLGKDGGLMATPIIHHPEVAILGVHKIKQMPVVVTDADGEQRIEIGERMNLSCSFDHRVIDGHVGAAFLYQVIRWLEAPELLLADVG